MDKEVELSVRVFEDMDGLGKVEEITRRWPSREVSPGQGWRIWGRKKWASIQNDGGGVKQLWWWTCLWQVVNLYKMKIEDQADAWKLDRRFIEVFCQGLCNLPPSCCLWVESSDVVSQWEGLTAMPPFLFYSVFYIRISDPGQFLQEKNSIFLGTIRSLCLPFFLF